MACCGIRGTEYNSPGISPFEGGLHYRHYRYHSLASGQTTGREHSPTHQQKTGFTEHGPFRTVHGVLKARMLKWFAIPFSRDHVLSELSTVTRPSWVALHGMAHSFIESDKAVVHVIRLVSFLRLWFSFCLPSDELG